MIEDEALKPEEKSIIAYLKGHPRAELHEIYQAIGVDQTQGYNFITTLLAHGIIRDETVENPDKKDWFRPHLLLFHLANPE